MRKKNQGQGTKKMHGTHRAQLCRKTARHRLQSGLKRGPGRAERHAAKCRGERSHANKCKKSSTSSWNFKLQWSEVGRQRPAPQARRQITGYLGAGVKLQCRIRLIRSASLLVKATPCPPCNFLPPPSLPQARDRQAVRKELQDGDRGACKVHGAHQGKGQRVLRALVL